jgi:hypothetical protein
VHQLQGSFFGVESAEDCVVLELYRRLDSPPDLQTAALITPP